MKERKGPINNDSETGMKAGKIGCCILTKRVEKIPSAF